MLTWTTVERSGEPVILPMLPLPTVFCPRLGPTDTHGSQYRFEYLRRVIHFRQVDWEFAIAQMICLCISPRKVYQFVDYRKQTKNTWARDDPGFVILLVLLMIGTSLAYSIAFRIPLSNGLFFLAILSPALLYLLSGVILATAGCGLARYHSRFDVFRYHHQNITSSSSSSGNEGDTLEWTYCFDIHSNGVFPAFLICSVLQFLMLPLLLHLVPSIVSTFISNTLYATAGCYYCYVASLGYSKLPFISNAVLFLYPVVVIVVAAILLSLFNINMTRIYLTIFVGMFK